MNELKTDFEALKINRKDSASKIVKKQSMNVSPIKEDENENETDNEEGETTINHIKLLN